MEMHQRNLNDLGTPVKSTSSTQIFIAEAEIWSFCYFGPPYYTRDKFLSISIYDQQF